MRASRATSHGFTIVELAVSTTLLALIVLVLAGILDQTSRAWSGGTSEIERRRGSRALADFVAADLGAALLPVQGQSDAGKSNLQFVINPPSRVPDDYRNADAIFWQAPIATESSFGDIAEVGYFVKWIAEPGLPSRPALCRFFVNPSVTNSTTSPPTPARNPNFRIYDSDPLAWLSGDMLTKVAPATKAAGYTGLLAENVVGLWVRSFALDGKELPRTFDSRTGYQLTVKYTGVDGKPATGVEPRYLPATVQISIAQLDSHSAVGLELIQTQLQTLVRKSTVHDAEDFLAVIRAAATTVPVYARLLPGLRIYTTEVHLENGR